MIALAGFLQIIEVDDSLTKGPAGQLVYGVQPGHRCLAPTFLSSKQASHECHGHTSNAY